MQQAGAFVKSLLDCAIIEMGLVRLSKKREIISHAAKLSPQEQCATAFGFVTLNPPFWRSSLKSRSEPLTNSALLGSISTRTSDERTRMSRGAGPSTKSILYWSPEQPPPMTATRNAPCGRPCFSRSDLSRRDAFSVTLINRSFPILIFRSTGATDVVISNQMAAKAFDDATDSLSPTYRRAISPTSEMVDTC